MSGMLSQMQDLASPVAAFISDCYTVTGNDVDRIPMPEAHRAYKQWCEDMGTKPVSLTELMRRINAASTPGVSAGMRDAVSVSWNAVGKRKRDRYILGVK